VPDHFAVPAVFDVDPPNVWGLDDAKQRPAEAGGAWALEKEHVLLFEELGAEPGARGVGDAVLAVHHADARAVAPNETPCIRTIASSAATIVKPTSLRPCVGVLMCGLLLLESSPLLP
jgi:hypothetical protein